MTEQIRRKIDWPTTLFLFLTPIATVALLPIYVVYFEFQWWHLPLTVLFVSIMNMSITGGYHRLFAHRSYQAKPWVRFYCYFLVQERFRERQ